jgi:uncharacterized CHY-type Zn-finger protein
MKRFQDAGHLFRVAAVFLVGFVLFLILRGVLVPRSFGQYGHYRGGAIGEMAALPISYAGHQVCEGCHTDVADMKSKGVHKGVACESCHGPLAKHAEDPASVQPVKLDTAKLCVRCHEANLAKPKNFPQVSSEDHSGGAPCDSCHKPHSPAITGGGSQ